MDVLFMNTHRNGYHPNQCSETLTVGELIEELSNYDENLPVYFNNDNGYTYGSIARDDIYDDSVRD